MKRFTTALLSFIAIMACAASAYAQTGKITFTTEVTEGDKVNLIIKPLDKVKVEGAHAVTIQGGVAWEVEEPTITITGPIEFFDCNMSRIKDIKFENCTAMKQLFVNTNIMTKLDLTGMSALTYLDASSTNLIDLNLKGCSALTTLKCDGTKLETIQNIQDATKLKWASFNIGQLKSIDLSGLNALKEIDLSHNNLTDITVNKLPALTDISLTYNPLKSASFSNCDLLETLNLSNGALESFTAKGLPALSEINLYKNKLTKIELSELPVLLELNLASNKLSEVDLSKCTALSIVDLNSNLFNGTFELKNSNRLKKFNIGRNAITSFKLTGCPRLEQLIVQGNKLTDLDLSACTSTNVNEVYAENNLLTSVKLVDMKHLSLAGNQLTSIDLTPCKSLKYVDLGNNKFTGVDFSNLASLKEVYIYGNSIKGEDMNKVIASLRNIEISTTPTTTTKPLTEGEDPIGPTPDDPIQDDPKGYIYAVESQAEGENNICTVENVAAALAKNWIVNDFRTHQAYKGAELRTITCKTEGKGGSIKINGKDQLQLYTDTKVTVTVTPDEGYGLADLKYRSFDIFNDKEFFVTKDGEVVATFTDKICKVRLRREGHGILELEGKNFDLNRMPIGREIKVVADIYPVEEYERELSSLKANDKDIIGDKSVKLEGDTKIVAVFDWLGDGDDPYAGEIYDNAEQIEAVKADYVVYPNPANEEVFVANAAPEAAVKVYSLDGVRLYNGATDAHGNSSFNVSTLSDGVYIVSVGGVSKRLVVRH